jgi:hypothetical protein
MLRASLFVATLLAGTTPGVANPAFPGTPPSTGASIPDPGFNRPIDLSAGFRGPVPPPADEPTLSRSREEDIGATVELAGRLPGLPRTGIGGIASRREHTAMFRLQGVTLFGGSVAGRVDGRSAHIMLSWPTSP